LRINKIMIYRFIVLIVMIVIWQALVDLDIMNKKFISSPHTIAIKIFEFITTGRYMDQIFYSLTIYSYGLIMGILIGVFLALFFYLVKFLKTIFTPYLLLLLVIPKVIFFPLFVKIFIDDNLIKIMFVALLYVTIFIYFGIISNLELIDEAFLKLFKLYGAGFLNILTRLILPATTFSLLANIRLAASFALVGTIFADMMLAPGTGHILLILVYSLRVDDLYGIVILISIIAVALNLTTKKIESWAQNYLRVEKKIQLPLGI